VSVVPSLSTVPQLVVALQTFPSPAVERTGILAGPNGQYGRTQKRDPVCDISKCIASIHLIEKRYIHYLQYWSTGVADLAERSSRAWKLDTGTTTRPMPIRDSLHTAHGSPSCAVLNADGLDSSTMHLPAQSGS